MLRQILVLIKGRIFKGRIFCGDFQHELPLPLVGRGQGWGSEDDSFKAKFQMDALHHAVDIRQHVIIPEAQYFIALTFQPCRSLRVSDDRLIMCMLATIAFDNQIGGVTGEVGDEISDGGLAPEMKAGGFKLPQFAPEMFFCIGLVFA